MLINKINSSAQKNIFAGEILRLFTNIGTGVGGEGGAIIWGYSKLFILKYDLFIPKVLTVDLNSVGTIQQDKRSSGI